MNSSRQGSLWVRALVLAIIIVVVVLGGAKLWGSFSYHPPFVPITFAIDSDGNISVSVDAQVATPIGDFSLNAGGADQLQPPSGGLLMTIQHILHGQPKDAAYQINENDDEKIVSIDDGQLVLRFTGQLISVDGKGHHSILLTSPHASGAQTIEIQPQPAPTSTNAQQPPQVQPTDTPVPQPQPTDTPVPQPTDTPVPPTPTPRTYVGNIAGQGSRSAGSDAVVDENLSTEWAGGHGSASEIDFSWSTPVTIHRIVVWDRSQNSPDNNQINGLGLSFSDGTVENNIDMVSGGPRCADITFGDRTVTSVHVYPVDSSGTNGYKEIEIWATSGPQSSGLSCSNQRSF